MSESPLKLPPPRTTRTRKILVALTDDEHEPLAALARERGEPVAVVARTLLVAALSSLRAER